MDANFDGPRAEGTRPWEKSRNLAAVALLLAISYWAGLKRGREEKTSAEYVALRSQYDRMLSEYDRASGQYSIMKTQCDQTSAQYAILKAQYDAMESARRARP
jgi:hypothetical protein